MLTVPIPQLPTYLSPSTYMIANDCEFAAWIMKWSGQGIRIQQTAPMAMGSIVDSYIKAEIAQQFGKTIEKTLLAELLHTVDPDYHSLIPKGKEIVEEYIKQGCLRRLLEDGLSDLEIDYKEVEVFGVPLYCRLDAKRSDNTPVDWKVNGFNSKFGGKGLTGYCRKIRRGMNHGPHDIYPTYLEKINYKWAVQLLMYWWVLNPESEEQPKGQIEQICVKPTHLEFYSYKANISRLFATDIKTRIQNLWPRILKGRFHKPVSSFEKCHPFGHPRPCTLVCPAYQQPKTIVDNLLDGEMPQ